MGDATAPHTVRVLTPANAVLHKVSDHIRAAGIEVQAGTACTYAEIRIHGLSIACHPAPWDGPLHICLPGSGVGPCRQLGTGEQPTEVAAVILRMLSESAS